MRSISCSITSASSEHCARRATAQTTNEVCAQSWSSDRHIDRVVLEQPVITLADAIGLPFARDIIVGAFGMGKRWIVEALRVLRRFHHDRIGAREPPLLVALQRFLRRELFEAP